MSNQNLVVHFEQLRQEAVAEGSKGRIIHYSRVIKVLRTLPTVHSINEVEGVKGVGKKTRDAIAKVLMERGMKDKRAREDNVGTKRDATDDNDDDDDDDDDDQEEFDEGTPPPLPALLLAQSFDQDKNDPSGWLMSEKLDGVRAYWDGKSRLWSRLQNRFYAPKWFTDALPKIPLDGELYCGRGNFQDAVSIVRSQIPDEERWKTIRFCVFDTPDGGKHTFEERFERIRTHIGENHLVANVVHHELCRDYEHLQETLAAIVKDGGEGLMLRQLDSLYEGKRSKTLLKVKRSHDAEAQVIGHNVGKGRNSRRIGALQCKMECGKEFKLGSGLNDSDRDDPPPIGSIVTYSFNELTRSGLPRFPRFLRVRKDVTEAKDYA